MALSHYQVSNNLWTVPTLLGKCLPAWRIRYYVSHTILPWWGSNPRPGTPQLFGHVKGAMNGNWFPKRSLLYQKYASCELWHIKDLGALHTTLYTPNSRYIFWYFECCMMCVVLSESDIIQSVEWSKFRNSSILTLSEW